MLAAMRRFALTLAVFVLAGCGGDDVRPGAVTTTATGADSARAVIATATGEVTVEVEVADDESERARGLMGRTELEPDAGMVFLFPEDTRGAFWMKDTLIPLSIAFYAKDGRILRILDMEPCLQDPCPLYDPEVAYRGALEVNLGAFARWGVVAGDVVRLER
jgi:uncharacterized membrane protein (UPF0127 family)